jgi:hypothetical protein
MYDIQHCFICRPSESTVTEDAGIEPRTVATTALAIALALGEKDWAKYNPKLKKSASRYQSREMLARAFESKIHCKKFLQNSCIFFYQTFQKRENSYADKGFFGALQRRNFLSFEEGKVFLSLQG